MEGFSGQRITPCVLLVDDNSVVLMLMSSSLKELGCTVLSAGNGRDALEILHSQKSVDLVVTDLRMPVMDGLELLRQIHESERLRDLPVILCSADADEAAMAKAAEYTWCRYFSKPVHPEFLFEQIAGILSHVEVPSQSA